MQYLILMLELVILKDICNRRVEFRNTICEISNYRNEIELFNVKCGIIKTIMETCSSTCLSEKKTKAKSKNK